MDGAQDEKSSDGAVATLDSRAGSRRSSAHSAHSSSRRAGLAAKVSDFLFSTRGSTDDDTRSRRGSGHRGDHVLAPAPTQPRLRADSVASSVTHFGEPVKETHHVKVEYDPVTRKRVLNTYEIVKDLGAGQHGKVKLARDLKTGKFVAIKIVDRQNKSHSIERLTKRSASQEDKIRKEIAIMKKCNHPHVVKLLEVLDAENSRKIYMVLEYLERGEIKWQQLPEDLSGAQEPLLSLEDTKSAFRDVVCGLEYLHHQNIIHRDIKPSNLLVDRDGNVKISDFGVSFAANLNGNDNEFELAKTAGTPAFLAPELCQISPNSNNLKVTHKIDIWALGVTLYCLLFGCLPFTAESEYKLFDVINNDPLKFPDMSKWIDAEPLSYNDFSQAKDLLNKMLAKDPSKRIDIDEIKAHKFYLNGLTEASKLYYEEACWKKDMKIDVSNKEMDEAVIGLGGMIKKKFSDMKKAWSSSTTASPSSTSTSGPNNLKPSGLSSMSLKDSHSYIFSEAAQNISMDETNNDIIVDDMASLNSSSSFMDGKAEVLLTTEFKDLDLKNEPALPLLKPIVMKKLSSLPTKEIDSLIIDDNKTIEDDEVYQHENGNMHDRSFDKYDLSTASDASDEEEDDDEEDEEEKKEEGNDHDAQENDHIDDPSEGRPITSEGFDFRKELEASERRAQLTVNPSYASLDSYYDEGYNKFFSNPTMVSSVNLGLSNSSYSSRNPLINNNNSMRQQQQQQQQGTPSRISPRQSNSSIPVLSGSYSKRNTAIPEKPKSPLITQRVGFGRVTPPNIIPSAVPQRRPTPTKSSIPQSDNSSHSAFDRAKGPMSPSSSSSSDEEDKPFMINKKSLASRRYSEKKKATPVMIPKHSSSSSSDSSSSDDDNDQPIVITAARSPRPSNSSSLSQTQALQMDSIKGSANHSRNNSHSIESIPRTAIYGTKINLLKSPSGEYHHSDNNATEDDYNDDHDDFTEDSDDGHHLVFNFNRSPQQPTPPVVPMIPAQANVQMGHSVSLPARFVRTVDSNDCGNTLDALVDRSPGNVSVGGEIVDVPDEIIANNNIIDKSAGQNIYDKVLKDFGVVSITEDAIDQ